MEEFLEVEGVSMEEKRKILWDYCARCTVLPLVEGLFALGNEDLGDKAVLNSDKGLQFAMTALFVPTCRKSVREREQYGRYQGP